MWRAPAADELVARSLGIHAAFYRMISELLDGIAAEHGRFLLPDVHGCHFRRRGADPVS